MYNNTYVLSLFLIFDTCSFHTKTMFFRWSPVVPGGPCLACKTMRLRSEWSRPPEMDLFFHQSQGANPEIQFTALMWLEGYIYICIYINICIYIYVYIYVCMYICI